MAGYCRDIALHHITPVLAVAVLCLRVVPSNYFVVENRSCSSFIITRCYCCYDRAAKKKKKKHVGPVLRQQGELNNIYYLH